MSRSGGEMLGRQEKTLIAGVAYVLLNIIADGLGEETMFGMNGDQLLQTFVPFIATYGGLSALSKLERGKQ